MKNKLIITLLALTMTTAMLAGCGKEKAEVQTADTEAVAEVSTETKAVAAETETEGAELVYNTETDTEVVAKGDKTTGKKSDKADTKTDSTGSTKDSASKTDSKTDSKDAGTKTETKPDSTKNDSATQAPAETTTNTPAQTPAETPAPEPEPEAPAQNLCPYTLNQWLDLGDGWWGFYTSSSTPQETVSALNKEFTDVIVTPDATWTYDDWGNENLGDYDDYRSVQLAKYHMVPITN